MIIDRWTIAYRKTRANKFHRVTNWSGTWDEAIELRATIRKLRATNS